MIYLFSAEKKQIVLQTAVRLRERNKESAIRQDRDKKLKDKYKQLYQ